MSQAWNYGYVALGGALGAMARLAVGQLVRRPPGSVFPWHTFLINISGSFLLGAFVTLIALKAVPHAREIQYIVAIGFLGAYTTFSTFELETSAMLEEGKWLVAGLYVSGSVLLGLAAFRLGMRLMSYF